MAQNQDMCKMSMELNSALFDESGFSESARQFKYKTDPINDLLLNDNSKIVGSSAEGKKFNDSDVDVIMMDIAGVKVGYNPREAGTESGIPYLRLTRGPLTPAGYTKLQIYLNGNSCGNIENKVIQSFFTYEIERTNLNTVFLTNRKLINTLHCSVTDHGPAQTIQMNNNITIDTVLAYDSKIMPTDMNSWFERTRLKSWPSKQTCNLFKTMGTFYVGVGHSKSPDQDFEWRISPTRQELYLMLNLTPTQFRCYLLLKSIKKDINKICGEIISSYHCKTALFWTIENAHNNIWQPQNLSECVSKCLNLLRVCVTGKICPNYFIPRENMFETQVMNEIKFITLQKVIKKISIDSQLIPVIMSYKKIDAIIETSIVFKKGLHGASSITEHAFHTVQRFIELIKNTPRNECIQSFQDWVSPHRIDIDIFLEMLEESLCCLNRKLHLKSLIESNTFTEKDITAQLIDPSKTSHNYHEYCLKLASIAATRGAYSTCDVILQNVHTLTKLDIYCRCCISFQRDLTQHIYQNIISENIRLTGQFINQLSINDILQRFSLCLQFLDNENEAGIVVPPCHFEAHKTVGLPSEIISITMTNLKYDVRNGVDLVSVHPTAYLYFLQYKNSGMMNKRGGMLMALEKLEHINLIGLQQGTYSHPDTTLNLLGHIYTTKGWHSLALRCFKKSLQVEPHYNAVKWQVMSVLYCNLSIPEKNAFKPEKGKTSRLHI